MLSLAFIISFSHVALSQDGQANEPALREAFATGFKSKNPAKRIEALQRLRALSKEKTLLALAGGVRDPDAQVRKAAAEVIATCTDLSGTTIKPLCASLLNQKEDKDVRMACAEAAGLAQYAVQSRGDRRPGSDYPRDPRAAQGPLRLRRGHGHARQVEEVVEGQPGQHRIGGSGEVRSLQEICRRQRQVWCSGP